MPRCCSDWYPVTEVAARTFTPLRALCIVCVIDVLGFGILIPLVPYMGTRLGATPAIITPILGSYSLCQLLAAPLWGALSDRYGRRPILITSMLGAGSSYVLLALSHSVPMLLLSRALAGFMAGNITAAMAYATDISSSAERARSLGAVGAAIGVGFMLGPAIGGALAGEHASSADFLAPALLAAALSVCAALLVLWMLPESRAREPRGTIVQPQPRSRYALLRERPVLRWLMLATLLVTFSQSTLDSILALWAMDRYGAGPRSVGLAILALAIIAVGMQTVGVRRLVPRWGELRLAGFGIACWVIGMSAVALSASLYCVLPGLVLCAAGSGAFTPSGSALASHQAQAHNRGAVLGSYQVGTSLARVLAPFVSGPVFQRFGPGAPFLLGAVVTLQASWCMRAIRPSTNSTDSQA
jgi:DHA1 family tetracycline resistance protein-like MFS transporter